MKIFPVHNNKGHYMLWRDILSWVNPTSQRYSRQFSSSEPSVQSFVPSHLQSWFIHWPLLHWNWLLVHWPAQRNMS